MRVPIAAIWSRLSDNPDPKVADEALGQFDVIFDLARFFEAKKDLFDAQTAYRAAQKIATLNLAKDPSNASWRDKEEAAERGAVKAEKAAEAAPADAPQ